MTTRSTVEPRPVPKRKREEQRIQTSIRISARVYLYAKERYNIPLTVEETFKSYLERDGVDLSVPHDQETFGEADGGKMITFGDARREGLVDKRGTLRDLSPSDGDERPLI